MDNTYQYINTKGQIYFLHSKAVTLRGSGKTQVIYYFAKVVKSEGALSSIPDGWTVIENTRTGLPILKKA